MAAEPRSPCLTRFLSDFTLGFSDGLTVPFALTAGLSSLGRADTVIFAGLAELCAGSISMGIGGYLSARDEVPAASSHHRSRPGGAPDDDEELRGMLHGGRTSATSDGSRSRSNSCDSIREGVGDEKDKPDAEALIRRHLEAPGLSSSAVAAALSALRESPGGLAHAAAQLRRQQDGRQRQRQSEAVCFSPGPLFPIWPVASGLSISLGYLVGGIIPLSPYFFAATVGLGLRWSIAFCLVALMAFGSGKSWVLRGDDRSWRRCLLEGFQMLALGSLAAGAAVLCINLVGAPPPEPAG